MSLDALLTIFWGIVAIVPLVLVHEGGHFIAARAFGVRVTEFMIGLPGPSIGFERNGCRYGITCIPLGGYNRITGMEAGPEDPNLGKVMAYVYRQGKADVTHTALACGLTEEEAEEALVILDGWGSINKPGRSNKLGVYAAPKTSSHQLGEAREVSDEKALLDAERAETYRGLSCWKRLVVLFAGPLANVLLAFMLILVIFSGIGIDVASNTISDVVAGSPAAQAGLQGGDTITSIDGVSIGSWETLSSTISGIKPGDKVAITYERGGVAHDVTLEAGESKDGNAQIGIYAGTVKKRLSIGEALQTSWDYLVMTTQAYVSLLNPSTAATTLSQSTSIVGISVVAKKAADTGIVALLFFAAVISLSLGIFNLVPMPPILDGGKMLVEVIQKIIGREISVRVINALMTISLALLVLLFIVMLRQDIGNLISGGS